MATTNIVQMREYVTKAYSGDYWKRKVAKMPAQQVMAIYFRLMREGK